MKKFFSILAFLLFAFTVVSAQGNGCGNGNNGNGNGGYGNNGNGNGGYGNNGNGNGNGYGNNNAWGNWPQWVITWLENGGQVPMPLAVAAIHEARTWGQQNFGLNQGQMVAKYLQGQLTVDYISTAPPTLTFRLRFGGGDIMVVLDDL